MRTAAILATGVTLLSLSTVPPFVMSAMARDHGVMGQTWPVIEPDLLTTIDAKLKSLEASGGIARMQKELAAKTEYRVRNPQPVAGLGATQEPRAWLFDPSIVVADDIANQHHFRPAVAFGFGRIANGFHVTLVEMLEAREHHALISGFR
mgnify:CR=1 FL=1